MGFTVAGLGLAGVTLGYLVFVEASGMELSRGVDIVAAIGLGLAATAGLLGFSLAVGAFLAGLAFSRDPQAMQLDRSFLPLFELFSPFFFINLGLELELDHLPGGVALGAMLFVVAAASKVLGNGLPLMWLKDRPTALVISVSMIPRAEIAFVIMQRGLVEGVVDTALFTAMVVACALSCVVAPPLVRALLEKYPQGPRDDYPHLLR